MSCQKIGLPQLRLGQQAVQNLGLTPEQYKLLRELAYEMRADPSKWRDYTADEDLITSLVRSGLAGQIQYLAANTSSSNTQTPASISPQPPSSSVTIPSGAIRSTTRTRWA